MIARFAGLTFDSRRRQVTDGTGEALHLTPKAFNLLALLIERAPHVVTKTDIHAHLWPGAFVTDTTLVGLIKELRRTLHDDDHAAPIIRTAHRVGYAFCALENASASPRATEHWMNDGDRRIPLREGENTIGRDPKSDVWLDLAGVSRRHARVTIRDGRAEIEDLGSKNGTILGKDRLTGVSALRDGDTILAGPARITYRVSASGMSTMTAPSAPARAPRPR